MYHYVYILKTEDGYINKTYVGYSTDVYARLEKHNTNLGAKSTKGYKWQLIYKKRFYSKNKALSFEYKLKNTYVTYVGYTNDIKKRLNLHNTGKGAKFTKCKNWVLIYIHKTSQHFWI